MRSAALRALATYDVLFIRHGNTAPAAQDLDRVLTDLGQQQARWACDTYMRRSLPAPLAPFALTSPAVRCIDTARIVLDGAPAASALHHVPKIYGGTLQPGCSDLFKRLSYAPLSEYLADGAEARELLTEYADEFLDEAGSVLDGLHQSDQSVGAATSVDRRSLCVFGHAVYSAAAAHLLATERGHPSGSLDSILGYNMREACGFWVGSAHSTVLDHRDGTA